MMRILSLCLLGLLCVLPQAALALKSEAQQAEFSTSRLVAGQVEDGVLHAAVVLDLKQGWKTYWRSPGDAGFPFLVTPAESASNIAEIAIRWPYPTRFIEEWDLEVFGFKDKLTLPLAITLADTQAPTQLDLTISYAVCSDICINEEQSLSLALPAAFAGDDDAALVAAAMARVPAVNGEQGLRIESAEIDTESEGKGVLSVRVSADKAIRKTADVFIETDAAGLRFPRAEVLRDGKTADFLVPYEVALPAKTLGEKTIRLTFVNGAKAVETELEVAKPEPVALAEADMPLQNSVGTEAPQEGGAADEVSLVSILLLALLGGLVLNVMPCVLPVLSIKLLGAVKHGGRNNREVRQSFLASVAGILSFFVLLAGLTMAAKSAGQAVGWGFHFQSPEFLTFLALLVLLFAANMLGWFEIRLPEWLNTRIYDLTSRGALRHHHHLLGDYAMGAFAALMATPCTAPFLGTAVGFALSRGNSEIFVVFLALGLGLAVPYLAAALVPSLATRLPKPGAWMVRVRQFMGVLLLLSAAWLLWVLANQVHPVAAVAVFALSVLLGAVLHGGGRWRFLRHGGVVTALALALLVGLALVPSLHLSPYQDRQPADVKESAAALWQPFDRAAIAPLVAQGKVVVVDVTADWCLTCKFNKSRALDRAEVKEALAADDVVAMRADLTRPLPDIQAYLKEYGRYGIPFNIVYGPAKPDGLPLPELLDAPMVLDAISTAR
jgi:suppressor for copper-sensitivity B